MKEGVNEGVFAIAIILLFATPARIEFTIHVGGNWQKE
jgi:hypothetical protein